MARTAFKLKQFFFRDTKPCRRSGYVKPSLKASPDQYFWVDWNVGHSGDESR